MIGEIKLFFLKQTEAADCLKKKKSSLIGQNLHVSFYLQRNNETKNPRLHCIRCDKNELCKFGLIYLNKIDFVFNYRILLKCILI